MLRRVIVGALCLAAVPGATAFAGASPALAASAGTARAVSAAPTRAISLRRSGATGLAMSGSAAPAGTGVLADMTAVRFVTPTHQRATSIRSCVIPTSGSSTSAQHFTV
jgi:hypothetical protein